MYHLKLCRGRSYSNGKVTATKRNSSVFVEDKATADALLASGYFKLVSGPETPGFPPPGEVVGHLDPEQLESMGLTDLKKLAKKMGVDIKGLDKPGLIKAICAVEVSTPAFDVEALAGMELDELTAYAAENGISLEGIPSTKEDVLEAICVANGGSYTMIDLQKA